LRVFWISVFAVVALALAYQRAGLKAASLALGALILCYGISGHSFGLFFFLLLVFVLIALPLNVTALRQEWLTRPLLGLFRRVLPEISATERTALDAGTVWWDGELFSGHPDWQRFMSIPKPELSPEEQAFLDGPVNEFCGMLDEWRITRKDHDLPPEAWVFLKQQRFFGLIIPRHYGGLEFSALAHSAILARIASSPGGITAASVVAVPNSLGPAELLLHYGTEEQKSHYLPRLAVGDEIPCFGLTSPWAGSDAGSIPDKGVVCRGQWQGQTVLGMRLSFDKRYITLAPVATVIGLAFKLYDPEKLLGGEGELGITCALIPRSTPGLEIGKRHLALDNPFMNGPIRGKDLFVPLDFIIGGPEMAGQGWRMLMECLAVGRSISLPSNTTGGALAATLFTGAYARIRKQFNVSIGSFEVVQDALAKMGGMAYAGESLRVFTAHAVDLGEKPSVPSAIAKAHCTEMAQQVWKLAMDVHAGKGVMLGPSNYLARGFQGSPIGITVEGANLLTRGLILFGQGAIRCHPYVLKEITAVNESNAALALQKFDAVFWAHIGHVLSAAARSLVLGVTTRFSSAPVQGPSRPYYQRINRYSANLALMADACMALLGGSLKFRESISARLGEVLSQLYIMSAALKRFEDAGRPVEDEPFLQWVCEQGAYLIEQQLDGVLRHLPQRLDGRLAALGLRILLFPLGRRALPASDAIGRDIATRLQQPGPTRERLFAVCFRPDHQRQPAGLLKAALLKVIDTETLERRVLKLVREGLLKEPHPRDRIQEARAKELITAAEAQSLTETLALVETVCKVDEFDPIELRSS
jgi:acyl-CoA dehydrogenase